MFSDDGIDDDGVGEAALECSEVEIERDMLNRGTKVIGCRLTPEQVVDVSRKIAFLVRSPEGLASKADAEGYIHGAHILKELGAMGYKNIKKHDVLQVCVDSRAGV